jgi:hypothetical protein
MKKLIPATELCANYNIGISFIRSLQESGLIEIATVEETEYIYVNQLKDLERIVRLYFELDINLEGIETINHLMQHIDHLEEEISKLRNRLRLYEDTEQED